MHRRLVESSWGGGEGAGALRAGTAHPLPSGPHTSPQPCGLCLSHVSATRRAVLQPATHPGSQGRELGQSDPAGPLGSGLKGPAQPVPAGFLPSQLALPLAGHLPAPLRPCGSPSPDLSTVCVLGLHGPESWRLLPALLSLRALPTAASRSEVTEGTSLQNPGVAVLPGTRPPGPHHFGGLHPCLCPQHPLREEGWPLS